jgi:hypothetical protein
MKQVQRIDVGVVQDAEKLVLARRTAISGWLKGLPASGQFA